MKVWKRSILLFVCAAVLLLSTITVSAVTTTDDIGDVLDVLTLEKIVGRPNIDITTMTYELSGDTATLTMTVKGNIIESINYNYTYMMTLSNITYYQPVVTTGYMMGYTSGVGTVLKDMTDPVDSEVSVSGNTIIATFTLSEGESTDLKLWGYSAERDEESGEIRWMDYAPNIYSPYYSEDDDDDTGDDDDDDVIISPNGDGTDGDGNGGTPGFEAIAVIAAIAIALIILRRKK